MICTRIERCPGFCVRKTRLAATGNGVLRGGEHRAVAFDGFFFDPASKQAWHLVEGGVNKVGHVSETRGGPTAGSGICQVDREELRAVDCLRCAPGQPNDPPSFTACEMAHRRVAHQA